MRPYLEKTHHKKRAGRVAKGVGPKFKFQYQEKLKTEKKERKWRYKVECLLALYSKTLNSISSTTKKKNVEIAICVGTHL
jgi:predicted SpoU family rRNA methylase